MTPALLALLLMLPQAQAQASITGYVVKVGTGDPLPKVTVTLSPFNGGTNRSYTATTSSDGLYIFQNVDPGRYRLSATRNGFVRMEYGARAPNKAGLPLTLGPGQKLADVGFQMTPAGTIAGRIFDRDGEPLARVIVAAQKYSYRDGQKVLNSVETTQTNDLGEYRIFWLQPGQYFISATPPTAPGVANTQEETYIPAYYPGTTDASTAAPINLPPGTVFSGIDLTVAAVHTVRIQGRLINGVTGQPAIGAVGALFQKRAGVRTAESLRSRSTPLGTFEIVGVTPGSYELVGTFVENTRMTAIVPLEIGNADIQNLSVVLLPGFKVTGRLSLEGQQTSAPNPGLSQMRVMLRGESPQIGGNTPAQPVQADGTFTLEQVQRDNYRLTVTGMPQNAYIKTARYNGADILSEGLRFDGPPSGPIEIVVSLNSGRVSGTVQNDKQEASANTTVVLVPDAPNRSRLDLYRMTSTDEMGQFHLEGVPPGNYKAFSWEDIETGAWQDPDFIRTFEDRGQPIRIEEDGASNIQLRVIAPQV